MRYTGGHRASPLCSNIVCSALGVGHLKDLSNDLEVTHFLTLLCEDSHVICTIALALS